MSLCHCDRCGGAVKTHGDDPAETYGGSCSECGDFLCADCAGEWDEDGRCSLCQEERCCGNCVSFYRNRNGVALCDEDYAQDIDERRHACSIWKAA